MTDSATALSTNGAVRRLLALALASAMLLPCCTTFMRPVDCGAKQHACGELHDVKFCENLVVAVEGTDCASAGLSVGKPFCYVSTGPCVHTTYALKDHNCVVRDYTPLREWYECAPGTPTFRN